MSHPFLDAAASAELEIDQTLMHALRQCAVTDFSDAHVFGALMRCNAISARHFGNRNYAWNTPGTAYSGDYVDLPTVPFDEVTDGAFGLKETLDAAIHSARADKSKSLGVRHFLRGLLDTRDSPPSTRSYAIDVLCNTFGEGLRTNIRKVPEVEACLRSILAADSQVEDWQYQITVVGDRLVFQVVSVLDDYLQSNSSGLFLPRRALLTHFKDSYGGFTPDEIKELEELINNPKAQELEFQAFFDRHPHFLRRWDHREVYSQVHLRHQDENNLIPDFILTDHELQKATILDLKLPRPKLIRRQKNRDRFAAALIEARAQLLEYRDWFRDKSHRASLKERFGMEIYEPNLSVLIGRASEFQDAYDRQKLVSRSPDVEVVTYDDLLVYAKRRRLLIQEGIPPDDATA